MKRWMTGGLAAAALASVVVGCNGGSGGERTPEAMGKDEKATIKVMYYDERSFFSQYGSLFMAKFPNIDVQVVSTQSVKYEPGKDMDKAQADFIAEQQPDVLMLSPGLYGKLAEDGVLYELDTAIGRDKFDIDNILPGVTQFLKAKGGGKLYGLAPNFYSQALFYNKDLFQKYGVPLPKDQMSWEETLELARRFPATGDGDDRVYGFMMDNYSDSVFPLAFGIAMSRGLNLVDVDAMQLTMGTESWHNVLTLAIDAMKSGAVYRPKKDNRDSTSSETYEEYQLRNPFISGKAAMTIDGAYMMDQLKQAREQLKEKAIANWDVVTVPVDPSHPDVGSGMSVNQIFAVHAKSPQLRAAWEFVKFINGAEYARVMSRAASGEMLSRSAYIKDNEGRHLEAFYKLKPADNELYKDYDKLPQAFMKSFQSILEQEMQSAYDGKKSVAEALSAIQQQGQQSLASAKQAEADKPANAK